MSQDLNTQEFMRELVWPKCRSFSDYVNHLWERRKHATFNLTAEEIGLFRCKTFKGFIYRLVFRLLRGNAPVPIGGHRRPFPWCTAFSEEDLARAQRHIDVNRKFHLGCSDQPAEKVTGVDATPPVVMKVTLATKKVKAKTAKKASTRKTKKPSTKTTKKVTRAKSQRKKKP